MESLEEVNHQCVKLLKKTIKNMHESPALSQDWSFCRNRRLGNQSKFQAHVIIVDLVWNAALSGCGVHTVLQGCYSGVPKSFSVTTHELSQNYCTAWSKLSRILPKQTTGLRKERQELVGEKEILGTSVT